MTGNAYQSCLAALFVKYALMRKIKSLRTYGFCIPTFRVNFPNIESKYSVNKFWAGRFLRFTFWRAVLFLFPVSSIREHFRSEDRRQFLTKSDIERIFWWSSQIPARSGTWMRGGCIRRLSRTFLQINCPCVVFTHRVCLFVLFVKWKKEARKTTFSSFSRRLFYSSERANLAQRNTLILFSTLHNFCLVIVAPFCASPFSLLTISNAKCKFQIANP